MTKNDVYILSVVQKVGGITELSGVPILTIVKESNLSHTKIRATVKILQSCKLINEGFMQRNAKTYYITKEGKEYLKRVKGEID